MLKKKVDGAGNAITGKGEPGTAVKAPLLGLTVYAEMLLGLAVYAAMLPGLTSPRFTTYTNLPEGSTATAWGFLPVANGEPGTVVKAPVLPLMVYADTLFEPALTT
jgi:hypothetical protein